MKCKHLKEHGKLKTPKLEFNVLGICEMKWPGQWDLGATCIEFYIQEKRNGVALILEKEWGQGQRTNELS